MQEYNRYVRITNGDPMKLARMLDIQSWFDNKDQLATAATSMAKYLQQSEKVAILPEEVAPEYIELLLWAMEQTDSPNPIVRERWWESIDPRWSTHQRLKDRASTRCRL